ncbi:MAG TPA: PorP/SprF family type IX secretion system membrane protein [Chitinophagales bacterium]|nr:PorP/SprF family type IX secretion system membrane protein [Chitinophagales bacterium]
MKKFTLLVSLLFSVMAGMAQDIHYSQFYASPLTLNPALTGVNSCNYRVGVMYRSQWSSVSADPYTTPSISFDINNVLQRIVKTGTLSMGALVLNDKAGSGDLSNLTIAGSIAYQRPLTASRKLNLSIGIQPGYVQKKLDFAKLTFENQFNGQTFDPTLSNGENFKDKFGYFDLNAGLYLTYDFGKNSSVFLGGSLFHIIPPKESFLNSDNKLGMRISGHGGIKIGVTDKLDIIPQVLFMTQSKAQEINLGLSLEYNINPDVALFIGGYDRLGDAIIGMAGLEFKRVRLGFSYDVNTSALNEVSNNNGGFELSLSYTGCLGGFVLDKPIMFCPRY